MSNPSITTQVFITSPEHKHLEEQKLSFSQLPESIQSKLQEFNISTPTGIQEFSFAPVQEGLDVLAQSMTGSGKTLAFSLPLALRYQQSQAPGKSVKSLILAPTRELAEQILNVFQSILSPCRAKVGLVIGGASYNRQEQMLRSGVNIVIGTPGRVADLSNKGILSLDQVETLVLDEVDQMLDIGFAKELNEIRNKLPESIQTLFYSATLEREANALAQKFLTNPVVLRMKEQRNMPTNIEHGYFMVKNGAKIKALINILLYHNPNQAIIFCETKKECAEVHNALSSRGIHAGPLHSDLSQYDRRMTMNRFKSGQLQFLIATNVAARGIDVNGLPLVINYTIPRDLESYTHRTGRTGRAGADGKSWSILTMDNTRIYRNHLRGLNTKAVKIEIPSLKSVLCTLTEREVASLINIDLESEHSTSIDSFVKESMDQFDEVESKNLLIRLLSQRLQAMKVSDSKDIGIQKSLYDRSYGSNNSYGRNRDRSYSRNRSSRSSNRPYRGGYDQSSSRREGGGNRGGSQFSSSRSNRSGSHQGQRRSGSSASSRSSQKA